MPLEPALPPKDRSTDAVEALAKLIESNEATLLDMGLRPHLMRAGLMHAAEVYHGAQRSGDPGAIAAADAEMGRVLRTTIERLAEGNIAAAVRLVGPPRRTR